MSGMIKDVTRKKRKPYNRQEDLQILAMIRERNKPKEIAEKLGRSQASIMYRVNRKLKKVKSLDEINYKE